MTKKEILFIKAITAPGCLEFFAGADIEVEGLNIYQKNGIISIFDRKGLIRRTRFCFNLWTLTEAGKEAAKRENLN